jgi:hypothetical protein
MGAIRQKQETIRTEMLEKPLRSGRCAPAASTGHLKAWYFDLLHMDTGARPSDQLKRRICVMPPDIGSKRRCTGHGSCPQTTRAQGAQR